MSTEYLLWSMRVFSARGIFVSGGVHVKLLSCVFAYPNQVLDGVDVEAALLEENTGALSPRAVVVSQMASALSHAVSDALEARLGHATLRRWRSWLTTDFLEERLHSSAVWWIPSDLPETKVELLRRRFML